MFWNRALTYLSFCWRRTSFVSPVGLSSRSTDARTLCTGRVCSRQRTLRRSRCHVMPPTTHLQSRPPNHQFKRKEMKRGSIRIQSFSENPSLCAKPKLIDCETRVYVLSRWDGGGFRANSAIHLPNECISFSSFITRTSNKWRNRGLSTRARAAGAFASFNCSGKLVYTPVIATQNSDNFLEPSSANLTAFIRTGGSSNRVNCMRKSEVNLPLSNGPNPICLQLSRSTGYSAAIWCSPATSSRT